MAKRKAAHSPAQALRTQVDTVLSTKGSIDSTVLLLDLVECFGGTRNLAVTMHEEFQQAPAGGLARQKFLQMVQHLVIKCTEADLAKTLDPSKMRDEEINSALEQYLNQIKDGSLVAPVPATSEEA